jgi:hypothetical protein
MITKAHKQLHRRWMMGKLNIVAAARRLGYKKGSLTKGVTKVRSLLGEMGITVL